MIPRHPFSETESHTGEAFQGASGQGIKLMEVIEGIHRLKKRHEEGIVILGFFDGFHLGHQALIKRAAGFSKKGFKILLYTFNRHPLSVVDPPRAPHLLTTLDEKIKEARNFSVDFFLIGEFNAALSKLEPSAFLKKMIVEKLKAKRVVAGFNYRYGKGHAGNVETLARDAKRLEFSLTVVKPVLVGGAPVSSSRIRLLLAEGKVEEAHACLGRAYALSGTVVKGKGRGKALGVPTANLKVSRGKLIPRIGIYAGWVRLGNKRHGGIISIGTAPTFGGKDLAVEVHLLDFKGDLYGKEIGIEFIAWERDQEKFPSPEALALKMQEDIRQGRALLGL